MRGIRVGAFERVADRRREIGGACWFWQLGGVGRGRRWHGYGAWREIAIGGRRT